jgi:hypothetical protein
VTLGLRLITPAGCGSTRTYPAPERKGDAKAKKLKSGIIISARSKVSSQKRFEGLFQAEGSNLLGLVRKNNKKIKMVQSTQIARLDGETPLEYLRCVEAQLIPPMGAGLMLAASVDDEQVGKSNVNY